VADEPLRRALLLKTILEILRDAGGPLTRGQVIEEVRRRVELNPVELSVDNSGLPRYERAVGFHSGDAGTIGWMTKIGGWAITEAGVEALESYEDAEGLFVELQQRNRAVNRQRKEAQRNLDEVQQFIANAVAVIEPGRWTADEDLAELTGTSGEEVAHFLASFKVKVPNSHRVLTADGTVPAEGMLHFNYRGGDLGHRLSNEGLEFDSEGRASPQQRLTADMLKELLEQRKDTLSQPSATQRAWMVRGTGIEGYNLVPDWLEEGWISLAASQLSGLDPDASYEELKRAVQGGYQHKSYAYQEQRLAEFDRFLRQMNPGDLVLTTTRGEVFLGRVTGEAYTTESRGGLSNVRRDVEWLNVDEPLDLKSLRAPIPALLQSQDHVVDLTTAIDELLRLYQPYTPVVEEVLPAKVALEFHHVDEELAKALLIHDPDWLWELEELLWERSQIILYGPPGTGKTYLAQRLARHLTEDQAVKLVQFHPSYTYEDFIEGFRPKPGGEGTISFELTAGPFRRLAAEAESSSSTPYILIIDEINRANLAKVFGELYFLLEYRDELISLQYSPRDNFSLPENLFIIGTMNTSDRSIALPDAAMRRRFAFFELHPSAEPTSGLLDRWMEREHLTSDVPALVAELNRRIEENLPDGRDHVIGPSYFMHRSAHEVPAGLARVWRTDIMPLLRELHFGAAIDLEEQYGLPALREATGAQASAGE
jgi:5-methylcytosine-specific restriction enzyme B